MITRSIDLNCDVGESPDRLSDGSDLALLDAVTSVNIACGGHAGDESTMRALVRAALERGVAVGAHPSYPDRAGFGRIELDMEPSALAASVARQVGSLHQLACSLGARLTHVKPHGALYHAAMMRQPVAAAIAEAVRPIDPRVILVAMAGAPAIEVWRGMGFAVAAEGFADRVYTSARTLRSRSLPGAVIVSPGEAGAQTVQIGTGGTVSSPAGPLVLGPVETVCVHSDTPGAALIARAVRSALLAAGLLLAPLGA